MAKRIITISREFGSGGRFIGEELAKKLGLAYYDKNIINEIAEKSGLSPEYIQESAELSPKKGLFAYAFAGRDITGKSVRGYGNMDHSYPYIASLTREPFLFYEMRSTAKLMVEGNSDDAIVKEIVEQNLFQYPTEKSITRMAKACIKRLHALEDDSLVAAIASQPTDVAKQIILFILMQSDNDIILIDQPEDDLDNKIIYDEVITAIAKKKQDIQFIFATHNANIPVLGDAERIFVVEYQDTTIDISQGNIDLKSTHKQIVDIMEGGEEAFDKRQLIYTSWK